MKFIKFLFKHVRKYTIILIVVALSLGASAYIELLPKLGFPGALFFGALIAVSVLLGAMLTPYHTYKIQKILDEKGYCDSYKDDVSRTLYDKCAVLNALKGNYADAEALTEKMDACIEKEKSRVFIKKTAIMKIYLIKGDLQSADDIKQQMLNELETFSEFKYRSEKNMYHTSIGRAVSIFDPRAQNMQ